MVNSEPGPPVCSTTQGRDQLTQHRACDPFGIGAIKCTARGTHWVPAAGLAVAGAATAAAVEAAG
eukprot:6372078-Prymnesium_polylepis.1